MTTVLVGMLCALLLALAVVALVAVPARREGRQLLTPQGEQLVQQARDRVVDLRERLPGRDAGAAEAEDRRPGDADRARAPVKGPAQGSVKGPAQGSAKGPAQGSVKGPAGGRATGRTAERTTGR